MAPKQADALSLLRGHGLKATTQRLAILRILMNQRQHLTAEEIHEQLADDHPTVSLSTVYDTLSRFAELGIVDALHVGDGATRFEFFNEPHVNVVCQECSEIVDVDSGAITSFLETVRAQTELHVDDQQIELRGYCDTCQPTLEP